MHRQSRRQISHQDIGRAVEIGAQLLLEFPRGFRSRHMHDAQLLDRPAANSIMRFHAFFFVRMRSSNSSLPSWIVRIGLMLNRPAMPAASDPTRPLSARYFNVASAAKR